MLANSMMMGMKIRMMAWIDEDDDVDDNNGVKIHVDDGMDDDVDNGILDEDVDITSRMMSWMTMSLMMASWNNYDVDDND